MKVEVFPLGPLETNSYLAVEGDRAIAVDVGGNPAAMIRHLERRNLKLTHILLTHLHFDHIFGVKALHDATGAPVLASVDDAFLLSTELGQGGFMGFPKVEPFSYTPLAEGETRFLDQTCRVLATPGHTPGSLSFYFPDAGAVFSGDLIFYRSIGRTDFQGGSLQNLLNSVSEKVFTLPSDTVIYSGHGLETSVGDERLHNPHCSTFAS